MVPTLVLVVLALLVLRVSLVPLVALVPFVLLMPPVIIEKRFIRTRLLLLVFPSSFQNTQPCSVEKQNSAHAPMQPRNTNKHTPTKNEDSFGTFAVVAALWHLSCPSVGLCLRSHVRPWQ